MAEVTLSRPPLLEPGRFDRLFRGVIVSSLDVIGIEHVEGPARKDAPRNSGELAGAIKWETDEEDLSGRLLVRGAARSYADVMNRGRRPGARGPGTAKLLFHRGVRQGPGDRGETGWTQRQMPERVAAISAALRARVKRPRKRKKADFDASARYLLSRKIAQNIHRRGIKPKRFVPHRSLVSKRFKQEVGTQFGRAIAALRERGDL